MKKIFKRVAWSFLALLVVLAIAAAVTLAVLENRLQKSADPAFSQSSTRARPAANPLRNAYFGDLHVHTAYSMDASIFDSRNSPRKAYEFAKGAETELPGSGAKQMLAAPLDFAAVTDHAEGMGSLNACYDRQGGTYWNVNCIAVRHKVLLMFIIQNRDKVQSGQAIGKFNKGMCGNDGLACKAGAESVWQDTQAAAREHYEPGYFTTFNAYEYSPGLARGGQLHRNVIFRGDKVPFNVFSALDGFAEDLLRWLDVQCKGDCKALTIPHNPNFSWGLMFGDNNTDGTPLTQDNLALRARFDKLVEVFQVKGSSECAAGLGTTDEQCNFENMFPVCSAEDAKIASGTGQHAAQCVDPNDVVRNVLKRGLQDEKKWGFNPYKFGLIAATDNHNGAPGDTQENAWNGHSGINDATPEQRLGANRSIVARFLGIKGGTINPGGLTGVWAEENTRESIWDALHRKETFGTSGTRVRARMFAGYDFPSDLHKRADAVKVAYATGVPMGSDVPASDSGKALSFLVMATRDANSAPLQRLQVVKGWVDGTETKEQVYDVACSDGLKPDAKTHRCADNGARVNLNDCSISADKGAAELSATWRDPDFKPMQSAFYYVRVLENPVCRYSQRDALKIGVDKHPADKPRTIQERAWTSPVWYAPKNPA